MARTLRNAIGGLIYHVINRENARMQIFDDKNDYKAFEIIMSEARDRVDMRILSYCIMPNHWHLVLWPREKRKGVRSLFWGN